MNKLTKCKKKDK